MLGLIVVLIKALWIWLLPIDTRRAEAFSASVLSSKEILPIIWWISGAFASVFQRREPLRNFLAISSGLSEIVPAFGLGIKPLGPRTLACFTNLGIYWG